VNGDPHRLADSESVSEVFHNHGVNMRYLGKVFNNKNENINFNL